MKVAINGAGVAGPTLAFWLSKAGHEVVLYEKAKELRTGGYIIDFWGVGYDIAEKMGIIGEIRDLGYQVEEVRFVNGNGQISGGFKSSVFTRMTNGRFTSVRRSDLAAVIFGAMSGNVSTIFNDSIEEIVETGERLLVRSRSGAADGYFDLVIGADGLHSRIREIAFGSESDFEVPLGYHVAAFEVDGYPQRDELVYVSYAMPGRQVSRFSMRDDKTLFLLVFRDEYLESRPKTSDEQRAELRKIFADGKWECPAILKAMDTAGDIYFDSVSQIRMGTWSQGRTALIGDAAACVSLLAGEGTGLAMAEAYVLAGELNRNNGGHVEALAAYESLLMPFLKQKQRSAANFASSFAPKTNIGIGIRNLVTKLLRIPFVANYVIGRDLRDNIELPDYGY